jgi:hypothetical protein
MWGEILTTKEVEYCADLVERLKNAEWAEPLLKRVGNMNSWTYSTKPLLFELRFAGDAHGEHLSPKYEAPTGPGDSTVDFEFEVPGARWLVELVSVLTSDALKRASWEDGLFFGADLQSDAEDQTQSIEGETLLVQQKIGQKVLGSQGPTKFTEPVPGQYHVILVDMRGYGITGGDVWDYRQIVYGRAGLPIDKAYHAYSWKNGKGERHPILGLFDDKNTHQRAARYVRERIHFIGFCNDESYSLGGVRNNTLFLWNPHLFADNDDAKAAFDHYPLKPTGTADAAAAEERE